jgi:hypothetical protein
MEETLKAIFTSYYFWLALEIVVIVVLAVFCRKYSVLKKRRAAELSSVQELNRYNRLDEMITNRKGENR